MKQIEAVFELFELQVRRLRNGNKLRLVFESPEDLDVEKGLIEFRGENVKAMVTQESPEVSSEDRITLQDEFEVFDLKCRRLRNGDKLQMVLEQMYSKEKELDAVRLRYENCKVHLEAIEQELGFDDDVDPDEYEA